MIYRNANAVNGRKELDMDLEPDQQTLELAATGLLSLRDGQATRIRCIQGSVWITEEGQSRDTILERGESYTLSRTGLAVITALGTPSRIALDGAAPWLHAQRVSTGDVPELAACA
jgi:hypothetical protein